MSVEVFRAMHNGKLPEEGDISVMYVINFLDKAKDNPKWLMGLKHWGSLFLTAKRMVYSLQEQILYEIAL